MERGNPQSSVAHRETCSSASPGPSSSFAASTTPAAFPVGLLAFPQQPFVPPFGFPLVPPAVSAVVSHFLSTGDLQLTKENAYPLLFWGHVLQMPFIVELSRIFLLQESIQTVATAAVSLPASTEESQQPVPPCQRPSTSKANVEVEVGVARLQRISDEEATTSGVSSQPSASKLDLERCCCDGPVTFQRVLNENYGITIAEQSEILDESDDQAEEPQNLTAFSQHPAHFTGSSANQRRSRDTYKCLYCQHSFKSYYCYQKHKRRHINPVTVEGQGSIDPSRVQLKDLNVQYFPCKSCGAKFPSYYFVHKHRKMCHPEETQGTSDGAYEHILPEPCNY